MNIHDVMLTIQQHFEKNPEKCYYLDKDEFQAMWDAVYHDSIKEDLE